MSVIVSLVGNLGGKVVEAVDNRSKRKHENKMKEMEIQEMRHKKHLEMVIRGQEMDNSWELEQIKNSGWKDEFVLLALMIPAICSFLPFMQPHIARGFEILETLPEYYTHLLYLACSVSLGVRAAPGIKGMISKKK